MPYTCMQSESLYNQLRQNNQQQIKGNIKTEHTHAGTIELVTILWMLFRVKVQNKQVNCKPCNDADFKSKL